MSNDPRRISVDRVAELLRGLGLDPVDPRDVRSVTIDPQGVEVVRYRRNDDGSTYLGFGGQPITETVTIGFEQ